MTKIISVNAGSSSLKFQLFEMPSEEVILRGNAERIGLEQSVFSFVLNGEKHTLQLSIANHKEAVDLLLKTLVEYKVVEDLDEIKAAGHRIGIGGSYFSESVEVSEEVVEKVKEFYPIAPLHNPAQITGYEAFKEALPHTKDVFVFDTAFHQTMKPESYLYSIPYEWYTDYNIRKYGGHGTSHKFVALRTAELMEKNIEETKMISCHLGNGASINAIDGGKCVDISMGFTPLSGIMMGTRCGDIDPAVVVYLMRQTGKSADEIEELLNKKSGMLGLSGISNDIRDIEEAYTAGDERAILAIQVYVNRIVQMIGGYVMRLGHVDAIIFTAGLGENDARIRSLILKGLKEALGLSINEEYNQQVHGIEAKISNDDSQVAVYVVPTNEELAIARDTYRIAELNS